MRDTHKFVTNLLNEVFYGSCLSLDVVLGRKVLQILLAKCLRELRLLCSFGHLGCIVNLIHNESSRAWLAGSVALSSLNIKPLLPWP